MNKIICDICGTAYPDTADSCPICGWSKTNQVPSLNSDELDMDLMTVEANNAPEVKRPKQNETFDDKVAVEEESQEEIASQVESVKPIFDFDAVNPGEPHETSVTEGDADVDYDDDDEEESHSNPFLVVILVILIVALLATTGFIFWRYYLPNYINKPAATTEPTTEVTELPTETEEPTVPCTGLTLVSGIDKLTSEGQNWLLHVKVVPEDTTDLVTFVSEDSSVVTVNEEGRVTVVGEGTTKVVITCGAQKIECPVVVSYEEETEATEETESLVEIQTPEEPEETEAVEAPEETPEAPEEAAPEVNSDIVLKLKKTDMIIGRRGVYVTLELDCDLTADQVEWRVLDANVALVDAKGNVTARNPGLTNIIAKYGDQEAVCIVRCVF